MADADARDVRARIIEHAAALLESAGPDAVTTRAVAEAAATQPPTIYRLFGDKDGLLEAVAEHVMAGHVARKAVAVAAAADAGVDPVQDLADSWTAQVDFGLAHPDVFRLLSDPARLARSAAATAGRRVLEQRVQRVAAAGRLRVGEGRTVDLLAAAAVGTIQTMLAAAPADRDAALPGAMLEVVLTRILVDVPEPEDRGAVRTAVTLRAMVPDLAALTESERRLLADWLDRLITGS